MNLLSVLKDFVKYNNGTLDEEATMNCIMDKLYEDWTDSQENNVKFESGLNALFDSLPVGTGIPTPIAVQTVCAQVAGGDFAKMTALIPACEAYLAGSTRFQSKRGRNGGLFRVG